MTYAPLPSYWSDTSEAPDPGTGDLVATSPGSLREGQALADPEELTDALRRVYDPEIPVNIYDLGLIYNLAQQEDGSVAIDMTLTAPGCPVAGSLPQLVADTVASVDGVGEVTVRLVWQPAWTPERMSEDARLALGMF